MKIPDLWLAQVKLIRASLAAIHPEFIPLEQLRAVLGDDAVTRIKQQYEERRREKADLDGQLPDFGPEATAYWDQVLVAQKATSAARSKDSCIKASKEAEKALALWDDIPPKDKVHFKKRSWRDPLTGKSGIDNMEWYLPLLKMPSADHPHLQNIEWHVQMEALDAAIEAREPPTFPPPGPNPMERFRAMMARHRQD